MYFPYKVNCFAKLFSIDEKWIENFYLTFVRNITQKENQYKFVPIKFETNSMYIAFDENKCHFNTKLNGFPFLDALFSAFQMSFLLE